IQLSMARSANTSPPLLGWTTLGSSRDLDGRPVPTGNLLPLLRWAEELPTVCFLRVWPSERLKPTRLLVEVTRRPTRGIVMELTLPIPHSAIFRGRDIHPAKCGPLMV